MLKFSRKKVGRKEIVNHLSFLAISESALNWEEFWTSTFFLSSIRLWSDSPSGLLAIAFTAVNGIAENTNTPASSQVPSSKIERQLIVGLR